MDFARLLTSAGNFRLLERFGMLAVAHRREQRSTAAFNLHDSIEEAHTFNDSNTGTMFVAIDTHDDHAVASRNIESLSGYEVVAPGFCQEPSAAMRFKSQLD